MEHDLQLQKTSRIIATQERSNQMLRKHNRVLNNRIKKMKKMNSTNVSNAVKKILNEDQLQALANGSPPRVWSSATIKKTLRLKFACGTTGYEELQAQNIPLPSTRTLRRRMENIAFEEGISNEVLEMLAQKMQHVTSAAEKDCSLVLDEMAIQPGEQYDPSTKSMSGKAFFPSSKGSYFLFKSLYFWPIKSLVVREKYIIM